MSNPIIVAALCVARNSVYNTIPGVECYSVDRDARTFVGGMSVVAHPPCRLWSAFCAHQAKANEPEAERELGRFCVRMVRQWGGVLEQPAHSRLWKDQNLPTPGWTVGWKKGDKPEWSLELPQFWFGDEREKNTWLFFCGLRPDKLPPTPLRLKPDGGDRRIWQLMSSKNQRERTPKAFAEWLIECARRSLKQ